MSKCILVALCLIVTCHSMAQSGDEYGDDKKKKKVDVQFSVIGGIDISSITGEGENNKSRTGVQFGVQAKLLDISDQFSLRGGAEFSQQGGKNKTEYEGEPGTEPMSYETKLRLNYLNFPITTQYNSNSGFYAEAGLQPGILLSAKSESAGYSSDNTDYLNKFDLGVVLGAGYKINEHIGIGARVTPGLLSINKKMNGYEPPKQRNLVFGVRGSYTF